MDAADTVDSSDQKKRKPKDAETPIGQARRKWAKEEKQRKTKNPTIDKYYELVAGRKLVLCHKMASGTVHKVLVGTTDHKETGKETQQHIARLQQEGRLKVRV